MKLNILLAPNSFKECADSVIISGILSKELHRLSEFSVTEKPLSDGGDGFLSVCENLFGGRRLTYHIKNIYSDVINPIDVLLSEDRSTIYIESADIVGLRNVPKALRNPIELNSVPLGELLKNLMLDVNKQKISISEVIIGVGGTATVDFGLGAASVFGLQMYDEKGIELDVKPMNYINVKKIGFDKINLPFRIKAIADVTTPLFGINNAIEMYSEQKGANQKQIQKLSYGFTNIYNILQNKELVESSIQLNGAGGGLAAGLQIFFEAEIITSSEFINTQILKDISLNDIDAVITGEGAFDLQSLENKGAHVIIEKLSEWNTSGNNIELPMFLVCGKIDQNIVSGLAKNVIVIELSKYFNSHEESIRNYETGLKKAAKEIVNHLKN